MKMKMKRLIEMKFEVENEFEFEFEFEFQKGFYNRNLIKLKLFSFHEDDYKLIKILWNVMRNQ